MTETASVLVPRKLCSVRSREASTRSLNIGAETLPRRRPRTTSSSPSRVTFTASKIVGPAPGPPPGVSPGFAMLRMMYPNGLSWVFSSSSYCRRNSDAGTASELCIWNTPG